MLFCKFPRDKSSKISRCQSWTFLISRFFFFQTIFEDKKNIFFNIPNWYKLELFKQLLFCLTIFLISNKTRSIIIKVQKFSHINVEKFHFFYFRFYLPCNKAIKFAKDTTFTFDVTLRPKRSQSFLALHFGGAVLVRRPTEATFGCNKFRSRILIVL